MPTGVGEGACATLELTEEIVLKSVLKSDGEGNNPLPLGLVPISGLTPKSCNGTSEVKRGVETAENADMSLGKELF